MRAVTTEIKGVKLCIGSAICWENYMPLLRQSLYSQNVNLWFAPTADARPTWESLVRTIGCEGRCFVVSANQCVQRKHLPSWITGGKTTQQSNGAPATPELPKSGRGRRKSTFVLTDEKNEICIPLRDGNTEHLITNGDSSAIDSGSSPLRNEVQQPLSPKQTTTTEVASSSPDDEEYLSRGGTCIISPLGEVIAGPVWEKEDELLIVEADFEDCERGRLDFDSAGSYSRSDSFKLSVEGLDLNPPPW